MSTAISSCGLRETRAHSVLSVARWALLLHFSLCFSYSTQAQSQDLNRRVSAEIRKKLKANHLAGIAVCIVEKGEPVYCEAFGYADVENRRRLTCDTPFQIASLSKQFAAVSVMLLVQEQKLKLDDPILDHLDGLPDDWSEITVRQLLSHTSGIRDYTEFPNIRDEYQEDLERLKILQQIYSYPLDFQPGAKFKYSNSGYVVAGHLIEAVSGMEYSEYLQKKIFSPLEMTNSRLEPLQNDDTSRAIGHDYKDGKLQPSTYNSPAWAFAAGGIVASVNDLAKWDAALDSGAVLPKTELQVLWEEQRAGGRKTEYGMGWMLMPAPGSGTFVYHFGGKPGFSTSMARLVENRVSIIVLSNRTEGHSQQILDAVGKIWLSRKR